MIEGGASTPQPASRSVDESATSDRPLVTMLLLAFNQEAYVEHAVRGALEQTYTPLEIVVSDDASTDGTWAAIEKATAGYAGPHRIVLNRNPRNLGIGAHISFLVERSRGALLFIAAADDISLPQRCERVVQAWIAADRMPDLISSSLIDLDAEGRTHAQITPSDLSTLRDARDWLARPPHVVGAAQAWTRRVFERFGPLPAGVVGEDLLMVFRAVTSGGAITLDEPLVQYRRGGISRRRRTLTPGDVIERLLKNNRNSLVELPQLLADARTAGQLDAIQPWLSDRIAREEFIRDMFAPASGSDTAWGSTWGSTWARVAMTWQARHVPISTRLRIFMYAVCPSVTAPFFAVKRWLARER